MKISGFFNRSTLAVTIVVVMSMFAGGAAMAALRAYQDNTTVTTENLTPAQKKALKKQQKNLKKQRAEIARQKQKIKEAHEKQRIAVQKANAKRRATIAKQQAKIRQNVAKQRAKTRKTIQQQHVKMQAASAKQRKALAEQRDQLQKAADQQREAAAKQRDQLQKAAAEQREAMQKEADKQREAAAKQRDQLQKAAAEQRETMLKAAAEQREAMQKEADKQREAAAKQRSQMQEASKGFITDIRMPIRDFTGISADGITKIEFTQGPFTGYADVSGDKKALDKLQFNTDNEGILHIGYKSSYGTVSATTTIYLSAPDLEYLYLDGHCIFSSPENLKFNDFHIKAGNLSKTSIKSISGNNLTIDASSLANVKVLAANEETIDIKALGLSDVTVKGIEANKVKINAQEQGKIQLAGNCNYMSGEIRNLQKSIDDQYLMVNNHDVTKDEDNMFLSSYNNYISTDATADVADNYITTGYNYSGKANRNKKDNSNKLSDVRIPLKKFNSISVGGTIEVVFKQGPSTGYAEVSGDNETINLLQFNFDHENLNIGFKETPNYMQARTIVYLTNPDITKIKAGDATSFSVPGNLNVSEMEIITQGVAKVDIASVTGSELTINSSNASNVKVLSAEMSDITAETDGASSIKIKGVCASKVNAKATSASTITLTGRCNYKDANASFPASIKDQGLIIESTPVTFSGKTPGKSMPRQL